MNEKRLRDHFGSDLARLARMWRTRLDERLSPLGLTQAKWSILLHLSKADGHLPQRALVDRVGVEAPTLVRVLDGLERLHLIERRDCPADRRTKTVHLTAAAGPVIADITQIAAGLRNELLGGIDDDALETCHAVLTRIAVNMGDHSLGEAP